MPVEERQRNAASAIRLHININESLCKRAVHVKGIYGLPQIILPLISEFQIRLELSLSNIVKNNFPHENYIDDEENTIITCKHESSSYYQFYKILSSEGYTLGKAISSFINAFAEQYRNPEESVSMLPLPLDSIKETVEQAIETLFTHYNSGRANSEKMMIYCRPAVEKYIYSKVYNILFPIYIAKVLMIDKEINRKRQIFENMDNNEIYKIIGIKDNLVILNHYKEACDIFDRIEELKSPKEKINCINNVINSIRASFIDHTKGLKEINEISDEVIVLVYIIIKSRVLHPAAQLELIKDYSDDKTDFDSREIMKLNDAIHCIFSKLKI